VAAFSVNRVLNILGWWRGMAGRIWKTEQASRAFRHSATVAENLVKWRREYRSIAGGGRKACREMKRGDAAASGIMVGDGTGGTEIMASGTGASNAR